MSGIAAVLHLDGAPASADTADAMLSLLAHRGPDGRGSRAVGPVSLGHARLAVTTEDALVDQPIARGSTWLVGDLRLDARRETIEALGDDAPLGGLGASDADLVLSAYARWGQDCARHLRGDFAFVLWDGARRRLVCARDPLGVRPLYYVLDGRRFACASEMRALFALEGVARRPHRLSIGLFLQELYTEREQTLYEGVHALPGGHVLVVEPDRVTRTTYWEPDPWRELSWGSARDYDEQFAGALEGAVRDRLRASGPLGVHASGGLDSSAVVGLAERIRRTAGREDRVALFSMVYPGMPCDERPFTEEVACMWGLPLTLVSPLDEPERSHPRTAAEVPDVYFEPGVVDARLLFREARGRGSRAALTGMGADQLMHRTTAELYDSVRRGALRDLSDAAGAGGDRAVSWRAFARALVRAATPEPMVAVWRRLRGPSAAPAWIAPELAAAVAEHAEARRAAWDARPFPSRVARELCQILTDSHDVTLALARMDRLAARDGCELRHPFLDVRVVELVLATPQSVRAGRGVDPPKPMLRRALRDVLPETIRGRRSTPEFTCYLERALIDDHWAAVQECLTGSRLEEAGIVRRDGVRGLLAEPRRAVYEIANLLSMELWLRDALG